MSNANFFAVLEQRGVVEDRLLLITASGVHYTYGDMQRESGRVANALRNSGVGALETGSVFRLKSQSLISGYIWGCFARALFSIL